jgi:hypothetical protein
MKLLRRVTEHEAIGEFLRNEFYQPEFNADRDLFEPFVLNPDYSNDLHNRIRRALLFRRRGHMWRELPADTQWWQVAIEPSDLKRVRVFPRAQWRKIANGSFYVEDIVERIRNHKYKGAGNQVIAKIQQLRYRLQLENLVTSTVLLIGIDEDNPVTVLEGNHRLSAALLVSPDIALSRFQIFCGFSAQMTQSCWYQTSFSNLWRYLKNRLTHIDDHEADVHAVMPAPQQNPVLADVRAKKVTESQ